MGVSGPLGYENLQKLTPFKMTCDTVEWLQARNFPAEDGQSYCGLLPPDEGEG